MKTTKISTITHGEGSQAILDLIGEHKGYCMSPAAYDAIAYLRQSVVALIATNMIKANRQETKDKINSGT